MKKMRNTQSLVGLKNLLRWCPNGILVEIGCFAGESTEFFAKSKKFHTIYAIDPWTDLDFSSLPDFAKWYQNHDLQSVEDRFDLVCKKYPEIIKVKMTSEEASKYFKGFIDMIYIDAIHTYEAVKADILLWKKFIKGGGFICGHDYNKDYPGVIEAVNEFGSPKIFSDNSWMLRKDQCVF